MMLRSDRQRGNSNVSKEGMPIIMVGAQESDLEIDNRKTILDRDECNFTSSKKFFLSASISS